MFGFINGKENKNLVLCVNAFNFIFIFVLKSDNPMRRNVLQSLSLLCLFFAFTSVLNASKPKEVVVPCSDQGRSDSKFFRASSMGKSNNQTSAQDKSLMLTKQTLASLIGSTLSSVSDNYSKTLDASKSQGFKQSFENVTREVVDQQLKFVSIICQKIEKGKDGTFTAYTAIEMPKEILLEQFNNAVSEDKKLKVDYDKDKFKEIFDAEMSKLESEPDK